MYNTLNAAAPRLDRRRALKLGAASLAGLAVGGGASSLASLDFGAAPSAPITSPMAAFLASSAYGVLSAADGVTRKVTSLAGLDGSPAAGDAKAVTMIYRSTHLNMSEQGAEVLARRGLVASGAGVAGAVGAARVSLGPRPDRSISRWADDPFDLWRALVDVDNDAVDHVGVDFLLPLNSHFVWMSTFQPLPGSSTPLPAPEMPDVDAPVIGVIDSGVDLSHPWMAGGAVTAEPGTNEMLPAGSSLSDEHGHGTAVCGVIRQANPNRRIAVAHGLGADGLVSDHAAADAIGRLVDQHGASVINLSFGALLSPDVSPAAIALTGAIADAAGKATVVTAAGNNGLTGADGEPIAYPAQLDTVTTVTASEAPAWANTGDHIDASAPGVDVATAYPMGGGGYATWSGTSFAAPAVAASI